MVASREEIGLMLESVASINDIGRAIQLALAPVFLLTGIAGLLNVMMGRLARIVDRVRKLTEVRSAAEPVTVDPLCAELKLLGRRRHLANIAIGACTFSALLVCITIAALFLEVLLGLPMKLLAGVLFTAATLALVLGLAFFLREVFLASTTVHVPPPAQSG
jgi:hypothetical protein